MRMGTNNFSRLASIYKTIYVKFSYPRIHFRNNFSDTNTRFPAQVSTHQDVTLKINLQFELFLSALFSGAA